MILTLLGMLGGGFMRLLPELLGLWNKKTDNAHELLMLNAQVELEKTKGAQQRETIQTQGDVDQVLALLNAQKEALAGQMQKTGFWIVDALNFLVRPLTTYYVLFLYGAAKVAMLIVAIHTGLNVWEAILKIYDAEDRAILSSILAFWFVGRTFDKKN